MDEQGLDGEKMKQHEYDPTEMLPEVSGLPREAKREGLPSYPDQPGLNIALVLGQSRDGLDALKKISKTVKDNFDTAWSNSEERREAASRAWKFFAGAVPRSWKPHEHAADVNIPIVLETISRLAWRGYQELFGDFKAIFDVVPVGPDDAEVAAKLTLHGNWQFCYQFSEFQREMHRAFLLHYLSGDWVCRSFWDPELGRNRHEVLGPDDYVVPWVNVSTSSDYSDVPFFCTVLQVYPTEIEKHAGEWNGIEVVKTDTPSWSDDPTQETVEAVKSTMGIATSSDQEGAPRKVLQYEGWLMLPKQTQQRYCRALVDYSTGEVFWLSFQEEDDPVDVSRYEQQVAELEAYRNSALAAFEQPGLGAEMPLRPEWLDQDEDAGLATPKPPKRIPLHLRAHGVCIEPVKGPLGLGFGIIATAYNECANWALDGYLDQINRTAAPGWLTTNKKLADLGELSVAPCSITHVPVSPMEFKDALRQVDAGQADPQAVQIVQMMRDFAQTSSHATDIMSGRPGKSGESARGQNERLEQAMSMLSVSAAKFMPAFEQILKNNAKLNSIHLNEEEFFEVTRSIPMPMGVANLGQQSVARSMYERPYSVTMRGDVRFISRQQRIAEANQMMGLVMGHPQLAGNTDLVRYCLSKVFESMGRWDIIEHAVRGWQKMDAMPQPMPGAPPGAPPGPQQGPPAGSPAQQGAGNNE